MLIQCASDTKLNTAKLYFSVYAYKKRREDTQNPYLLAASIAAA